MAASEDFDIVELRVDWFQGDAWHTEVKEVKKSRQKQRNFWYLLRQEAQIYFGARADAVRLVYLNHPGGQQFYLLWAKNQPPRQYFPARGEPLPTLTTTAD